MNSQDKCERCHQGPVHHYHDASQCEACGAYTDSRHRHQPTPLPRTSAAAMPIYSGRPGPLGLPHVSTRQIIPDLNLTH